MKKVIFKSSQKFFNKERMGIKNNTVREVDIEDERFNLLRKFFKGDLNKLDIEIICTEYSNLTFKRKIKDVSFWNNLCIITWEV